MRGVLSADTCPDPSKPPNRRVTDCAWSQFEVIFVHPSGQWKAVGVDITDYDVASQRTYVRTTSCVHCGGTEFRVDTTAIDLSGWYLKCARCNAKSTNPWIDHEEETARLIGPFLGRGTSLIEARMQKINYAAAAAYHVHGETFIDFPEGDLSACLDATSAARLELERRIASRCGYIAGRPGADEAIRQIRETKNADWIAELEDAIASYEDATSHSLEGLIERTRRQLDRIIDRHLEAGVIVAEQTLPSILRGKIRERVELWSSRYDPFRLIIEHEALSQTKLGGITEGSRRSFVPFDEPDDWIMPDSADPDFVLRRTASLTKQLGLSKAGIIPKFDLCKFTFGFSTMSSRPWMTRHNVNVPVRLCLFPKIPVAGQRLHPLYVLTQQNEAYYFRLHEQAVRDWLEKMDCVDRHFLESEPSLAGAILMSAEPRDRFLTAHDSPSVSRIYDAVYSLLHSYAHHVMKGVSTYSGLDLSSLGEYVFPADLAFVVYRTGMTIDLGNLSALWRNNWLQFLEYLARYNWTLGCNLGALCTRQGGACPDCLMIPEVCCIAANRYLSRSLLIGNGKPAYLASEEAVPGFLVLAVGHTGPVVAESS